MFDSPFFNSVIAMITLYLIFSQLTLSLVELPAGLFNDRGRYLFRHLKNALGRRAWVAFYTAPTIRALMSPNAEQSFLTRRFKVGRWPAYVSETLFAQTIIAWVSGLAPVSAPPRAGIDQFQAGLTNLTGAVPAVDFTGMLDAMYANAKTAATLDAQSQALQKNLEAWFHEYGERMTGWYKRDRRGPLFWAGLLVAVLADVDTVRLTRFVSDSKYAEARMALVAAGTQAAQGSRPAEVSYRMTDSAEAAAYNRAQVTTWNETVNRASANLKNTLAAVPQVGLPLGFVRWSNHGIDTVYKQLKDTTTVADAKSKKRIPTPKSKQDSVKTYQWANTADDFGMPSYAQRQRLNAQTGQFTSLDDSIFFGITWQMLGGWLLTAFALMLGAPFWFDTLCRFVNIRNIGIKPTAAVK